MKIIQLLQKPQLRGAEIFACQLSNHLQNKGNEVLMVSIFKGDAKLPYHGEIINLNRPLSKRLFDSKGWREFNKIIKKFKPDIIQANAADTLKFAVSSKMLFSWKQPIVFRNANKMGDFIDSKFKWKLNNFYLTKVSHVISVSHECENDFIHTFPFPKNKIDTIEIGVEEQELGELPPDLQKTFGKGPVLVHIGGFVPEKNHGGLLVIFNQIVKEYPTTQLVLIGKGKLEDQVRKSAADLHIQEHVHFLGYRNDVLNILRAATVFVMPSLIEGLPAVILEAMYCKTPVVAYNVGGISEIVTEKTGKLIAKNDEEAFVKAVLESLDAPNQEQIETAYQRIVQNFMNPQIAERFAEVYRKVLAQSRV